MIDDDTVGPTVDDYQRFTCSRCNGTEKVLHVKTSPFDGYSQVTIACSHCGFANRYTGHVSQDCLEP